MVDMTRQVTTRISRRGLFRTALVATAGAATLGPAGAFAQNIVYTPGGPGGGGFDAEALIREHLAAFDAGDVARFKATVTPDVVYTQEASGLVLRGADQLAGLMQAFTTALPDLKETIKRIGVFEGGGVAEFVVTGTFKGPLVTAQGTIQPTGKSLTMPDCIVFTFRDGKIAAEDDYFDNLTFLTQLGIPVSGG